MLVLICKYENRLMKIFTLHHFSYGARKQTIRDNMAGTTHIYYIYYHNVIVENQIQPIAAERQRKCCSSCFRGWVYKIQEMNAIRAFFLGANNTPLQ